MTTRSNHHLRGLLIWWVRPDAAPLGCLPPYICRELRSLRGRAARNRLWVPAGITIEPLEVPGDSPKWASIAPLAGGIVFLSADLELVRLTDCGMVTDLALVNVWTSESEEDRLEALGL